MLKAVGLWAKTSVKGGRYLTRRLGGVKVLVMENRDRQSDDDPSHHLFFRRGARSPPERPGAGSGSRRWAAGSGAAFRTPQAPSEAPRRSFQAQAPFDHDDAPEWAR
jgi:hypothetical protein